MGLRDSPGAGGTLLRACRRGTLGPGYLRSGSRGSLSCQHDSICTHRPDIHGCIFTVEVGGMSRWRRGTDVV